ncbi:MFS transporter [Roseomonas sp. PWR1]|uniref:MFS transporter n=1 Tax=Roseomonas nitratireducens TaxID=2820810 RepID=A0ABS4AMN4_9PROT|nr:MFS transporter [Neoroseomonas nitratireducens]MBP0462517.1 MFS transporter [Neoroseomonas nitratireducens]
MDLLGLSVLALALGHVFSNAVRTVPALAADVLQRDLGVTAEGLAALTGAFPAAFALAMLPVGVALDRWGVKPTALALMAIAGAGALLGAVATGPWSMLLAQCVLGIGCSGMLMCPVTYAAKHLPPQKFGLWGGVIQAFGNTGMLLSASPLALLVEAVGWRAGYLACALLAAGAATAVALLVRESRTGMQARRSLAEDARDVVALGLSREIRGPVVIAFASFAAVLGVRGLWGGPWLMEVRDLSRIEAGNVLLLCTFALIAGPAIAGLLERRFQHRRRGLLVGGHLGGAAAIVAMVAAGAAGLPVVADALLLVAFGLVISFQVICFALVRAAVPPERVGRALSAMNISFFGGAAVFQAASGFAAAWAGIGAALLVFAAGLVACTLLFLRLPGPR